MITCYMPSERLIPYLLNQQLQVNHELNRIDDTWLHASIIKDYLKDLQSRILDFSNNLKSQETEASFNPDRKKEKYTQWVEVMRLALFQYERFTPGGAALSEGLYSTLGMLAATWNLINLEKVVVLGCGPGRSVLDFSKLYPTSIIEGLDYSLFALLLAEKIICGSQGVPLLRRDVYSTDYSELLTVPGMNRNNVCFGLMDHAQDVIPESDMIICSNVLNLLPNHKDVINRMYSSLRPGGIVVFADLLGWRLDRESWRKGICTKDKIATLFSEAGFITLDQFDGVPYVESESADQFVFYKEHFYVGRKV